MNEEAAAPAPSAAVQALRGLLRALAHQDVHALVLTTDELVQIERADRRAPLTQKAVTEAQIEALVAPTGLLAALGAQAHLAHPFALDGQAYLAEAWRGAHGIRIRIARRAGTPEPAAPTPPTPRSVLGAPAAAVGLPESHAATGASHVAAAALQGGVAAASVPATASATLAHLAGAEAAEAGRRPVQVVAPEPDAGAGSLRRPYQAVSVPRPTAAMTTATATATATAAPSPVHVQRTAPDAATVAAAAPCIAVLAAARAAGASDVHLVDDERPRWRRAGALAPAGEPLPAAALAAFVATVVPEGQRARLVATGYLDFACEPAGSGRLRANLSHHSGGRKLCLRLLPEGPQDLAALGLPAQLAQVTGYHQGLAVVSGPQGHGKSTTLAAIVDRINAEHASHVVCVEDPIEIVHPHRRALISQREVGRHTRSFARAIKASLREDPDVIVIGELRDREAVEMALSAAETGHLVLTTMNTRSAAKTIDRLIDIFPPGDQPQVRAALAGALKMIVSQRLLLGTNGALVAAAEMVTGCPPLWALIRDNKLVQLPTLQQRGQELGMLLLDQSLAELVHAGKVALPVALAACEQPAELQRRVAALGGAPVGAA